MVVEGHTVSLAHVDQNRIKKKLELASSFEGSVPSFLSILTALKFLLACDALKKKILKKKEFGQTSRASLSGRHD